MFLDKVIGTVTPYSFIKDLKEYPCCLFSRLINIRILKETLW